jgi:hypothetical protein
MAQDTGIKLSPQHKDDRPHERDDLMLIGDRFYRIESVEDA